MKAYNPVEILSHFVDRTEARPFGNGHINDTYLVEGEPRLVLQRINTSIFKNPAQVMENISLVTEFLKKKIAQAGGNPDNETLTVIPTKDGKLFYEDADGNAYRMYRFIEGAKSFDAAETPEVFAASASAFGKFQRQLADFPAEKLHETIPLFHDTGDRLRQFREALAKNASGRADGVKADVDFVLDRAHYVNMITDAIAEGTVPLRVTHNDTKLNNVMLNPETLECVCVVDLDTVMPGSMLYDYGDSLRFGASTGAEDEKDLSKIWFDLTYFEAYTKAFLAELGDSITQKEKELMPLSALMMTLECGMRFLADYINGDVYFHTAYPEHNLDRARTQFKLVADMEEKMEQMKAIVAKY